MPEARSNEKELQVLREEIEQLRAGLNEMMDNLQSGVDKGEHKLNRFQQQLNRGRDWLRETVGDVRDTSQRAWQNAHEKLEHKPFTGIMAALGAGFLLGWFLKRR